MNAPWEKETMPHTEPNLTETKREHPLTEILRFSLVAILIVVPIRMFVAQPFIVSGASMQETFESGEYLIVDQVSYYFEAPKEVKWLFLSIQKTLLNTSLNESSGYLVKLFASLMVR